MVDPIFSAADPSAAIGFDPGNHLPTETHAKIGAKVHDDHLHKKKSRALQDSTALAGVDQPVSPLMYALNKAGFAGLSGGQTIALFGTLLTVCSYLSTALLSGALGSAVAAIPGMVVAGIIWYGVKEGLEAYSEAKTHNSSLLNRFKDRFNLSPEHQLAPQHEVPKDIAPVAQKEKPVEKTRFIPENATVTGVTAGGVGYMNAAPKTQKPSVAIQKILDQGPRRMSPKELAAQIETERTQNGQPSL